jgi:hypothetical protein
LEFLNKYMEDANRQLPSKDTLDLFDTVFQFLAAELPDGIIRGGRQITPVNLYEAVSVGTARVFTQGARPRTGVLQDLLNDNDLRELTSGGTNSRRRVVGRIEFVRDRLL